MMRFLTHIALLLVLILGGFWAAGNTHMVAITCPLLGTVSLPLWSVALGFAALGALVVLLPSRAEVALLRIKLKRAQRTTRQTADMASGDIRLTPPPPPVSDPSLLP